MLYGGKRIHRSWIKDLGIKKGEAAAPPLVNCFSNRVLLHQHQFA